MKLVGTNIEHILCSDYINTSLMRKLGHYIHSLIFTKHFEREVERESESREWIEEELERESLGLEAKS